VDSWVGNRLLDIRRPVKPLGDLSRSKREDDFKSKITAHIEYALPLVGDGDKAAVPGVEILRQVQMVGVPNIGQVRAIKKERADHPAGFAVDEPGAEYGIDEGVGCRGYFGEESTVNIVLLPIVRQTDLEICR